MGFVIQTTRVMFSLEIKVLIGLAWLPFPVVGCRVRAVKDAFTAFLIRLLGSDNQHHRQMRTIVLKSFTSESNKLTDALEPQLTCLEEQWGPGMRP